MERFKFRAWDTHCKRMRDEQDYVVDSDTGLPHWIHDNELIQGVAEQLILMQCTGLKDKEGRLIYEGDIVEVVLNKNYPTPYNCTIVFKGMGFWFMDENEDLFVFHPETYHITVIGNIYETK